MNMLAKSKTRKGDLGKKWAPRWIDNLQKAIQAKTRATKKKLFPGGSKTRKGDPGKNGMMKEKWNEKTCESIDHRCDVQSTYATVPTSSNTIQLFFSIILQLPAFSDGLDVSSSDGIPRRGTFAVYVRARAITCPIFRCFVCLCEIVSTNCQSSCIPKHSCMHNHASYMFMHLIKLSCYSYASAFSIPMLISIKINLVKFLLPTINVCCHVNLKVQQSCQHSCQIQAPAVMSIKVNSFSNTICFC